MKYLTVIAITDEGQEQMGIPMNLVEELNDELENYPDGIPVTLQSGKVVKAPAFLIPTKAFTKTNTIFVSETEDTK
ncbi:MULTISPECIES: hypothetical protein [unclassified Mammaliicoccus]|uniref:hypothetical protein n=1 Tax=unclassified Mammaliicoccus TaxID=2803851 RepID=UPI001EFA944C|nr:MULTISPECIES: hypothetical protein [unclassified Mammaliicoccus]